MLEELDEERDEVSSAVEDEDPTPEIAECTCHIAFTEGSGIRWSAKRGEVAELGLTDPSAFVEELQLEARAARQLHEDLGIPLGDEDSETQQESVSGQVCRELTRW